MFSLADYYLQNWISVPALNDINIVLLDHFNHQATNRISTSTTKHNVDQ